MNKRKGIVILCLSFLLLSSFTNESEDGLLFDRNDINELLCQENGIQYERTDSSFTAIANNVETTTVGDDVSPNEIDVTFHNGEYDSFSSAFEYDDSGMVYASTPDQVLFVEKDGDDTDYYLNDSRILTVTDDGTTASYVYPNSGYESNETVDEETFVLRYDDGTEFTISMDADDNVLDDGIYSYAYDEEGNLIGMEAEGFSYNAKEDEISYGGGGDIVSITNDEEGYAINGNAFAWEYDDEKRTVGVYLNGECIHSYSYDSENGSHVLSESTDAGNVCYEYDDFGNIESMQCGEDLFEYKYDSFDRLRKASYPGYDFSYEYDLRGNLLSEEMNGICRSYEYEGDQLMSMDGTPLYYDDCGNLVSYGGNEFRYVRGQRLSSWENGNGYCSYDYGANAIRTSKVTSEETIDYFYKDNRLMMESSSLHGDTLYVYDKDDNLFGFVYSGRMYLYRRDFLGNILGITDTDGNEIVKYQYDPYGKVLELTDESDNDLSLHNHMLYKGYYYDAENELYYILNRYYSPEMKRFITRDKVEERMAVQRKDAILNLYNYADSNPVMKKDENGLVAGLAALTLTSVFYMVAISVLSALTITMFYIAIRNAFIYAHNQASVGLLDEKKNEFKDFLKSLLKSVSESMGGVISYVSKWVNKYRNATEKHHIIARSARRHALLKYNYENILNRNVNWLENLAEIKKTMHKHLHTTLYYTTTNALLLPDSTSLNKLSKFLKTLKTIKLILEAASAKME